MDVESRLLPQPSADKPPGAIEDPHNRAAAIRQVAAERAVIRLGPVCAEEELRCETLAQRMLGHLCSNTPVYDRELLLFMIGRHVPFNDKLGMIKVSDTVLARALLEKGQPLIALAAKHLPSALLTRLMASRTLAQEFIRHYPLSLSEAPDNVKTQSLLAPVLESMEPGPGLGLLCRITCENPQLGLALGGPEYFVRCRTKNILELPPHQNTRALRRVAVLNNFSVLPLLKNSISPEEYEELCDLMLKVSGEALPYIDESRLSDERVNRAVSCTDCLHPTPPHIDDIPPRWRTPERLRLALKQARKLQYSYNPLSAAFLTQWDLWDTLKQKQEWLTYLPMHERTEALCCEYVKQVPARAYSSIEIPEAVRQKHPEWHAHWSQPSTFMSLHQLLAVPASREAATLKAWVNSNSELYPNAARSLPLQEVPPWVLLITGRWDKLPSAYKEIIWRNGGTEGLAALFQAPDFEIDPLALLDPVQEDHCSRRAAAVPDQVCKKLLFCDHFQPVNAQLGRQLHRLMEQQTTGLEQAIKTATLPLWQPQPASANWQRRGGRTLVRDQDLRCVHIKFQRQGETLTAFAAEQTVQQFARDNQKTLGLRSEIPAPDGIYRVLLASMPLSPDSFADPVQIYEDANGPYCLAFAFSTADHSYDTLAWQPDSPEGGCQQARQGLLNAFHDLGVWSSLGAVHTSTICLYHHFQQMGTRPELLLSHFFLPGRFWFPGIMRHWNTSAIEKSDLGHSGLRDLGDLEFYGFIRCYLESLDADWLLPGYGQRASYVNAIAQNILGGLLHYMRLYRDTVPDYHYRNRQQVEELARFLDEGCSLYISGLLGCPTPFRDLFPKDAEGGTDVYGQWLQLTARELIYWTARQVPTTDCFTQHFKEQHKPSALLYPGHPPFDLPEDTSDPSFATCATQRLQQTAPPVPDHQNLGFDMKKMPLFYLVRGLYVLAAGLADRLTPA